jgi:hypothetical protein
MVHIFSRLFLPRRLGDFFVFPRILPGFLGVGGGGDLYFQILITYGVLLSGTREDLLLAASPKGSDQSLQEGKSFFIVKFAPLVFLT